MPSRTPVSRRDRPAKPPLTREGIVDVAMRLLENEGFGKLTMRRLAAELDTGPASLYVYVRNTTELHALMIDRLLAGLDVTWSGRGDWRRRLHRLLVDYIAVFAPYPGLARSAVVTWAEGEHYLDLVEVMLRLLIAGGVPDRQAAWGVDILLQQSTAMAAEWATRESGEDDQAHPADTLLAGMTTERHPLLARLGIEGMTGGEGGGRRDWAIEALIAGVESTPLPD